MRVILDTPIRKEDSEKHEAIKRVEEKHKEFLELKEKVLDNEI